MSSMRIGPPASIEKPTDRATPENATVTLYQRPMATCRRRAEHQVRDKDDSSIATKQQQQQQRRHEAAARRQATSASKQDGTDERRKGTDRPDEGRGRGALMLRGQGRALRGA
jgi:hypothetical protein